MTLTYAVRFGDDEGITLKPHRYKTGYRASKTKFGPHIHVARETELIPYLHRGWAIRMSAPGHPPSLIIADSVSGWQKS